MNNTAEIKKRHLIIAPMTGGKMDEKFNILKCACCIKVKIGDRWMYVIHSNMEDLRKYPTVICPGCRPKK